MSKSCVGVQALAKLSEWPGVCLFGVLGQLGFVIMVKRIRIVADRGPNLLWQRVSHFLLGCRGCLSARAERFAELSDVSTYRCKKALAIAGTGE